MKVEIHRLFQTLLDTLEAEPEAILGYSLASSPVLADFLDDLDPSMSLDWSNQSFFGLPTLRQHVVERAVLEGICTMDDVLITSGAAEANYLAFSQLIEPGDEIVVERPGWPQALVLGNALGAKIHSTWRSEQGEWGLDLDELESMITAKTRLIFLSNPNNPTGRVTQQEELETIAELADRVGAYVLIDEVYAGLEWDVLRPPSMAGLYERGLSTGSVSKSLGLQGLRIGWLISRDRKLLFDAMVLRENTSEIMNVVGEAIAEIALRPDRYQTAIGRARQEGRGNLTQVDDFIGSQEALSWVKPQAGLIGLSRLDLAMEADEFTGQLLAAPYKTLVFSGSAYDLPQHIRLGVGGGEQADIQKGLARMGQLLQSLKL